MLTPRAVSPPLSETLYVFAIVSCMLFVPQLKSLTPVSVVLLVGLFMVWRRDRVTLMLRHSALYLTIALFALLSRFWSIDPGSTTYYGVQFLITGLAGCIIGAGVDRRSALRGLFLAFALYSVSSIIFGRSVGWGGGAAGNSAFAGLAQAKNTAGDCAAVGMIFSLIMLLMARRAGSGQRAYAVMAAIALLPQAYSLVSAHSSGAILGVLLAVPMIVIWYGSRLLATSTRLAIAIGSGVTTAVVVVTRGIWLPPLIQSVTAAMGKDSTLTGRTYLWDRADALIAERPLLGLGYSAFWRHGNLDAEGLWRHAAIASRAGFNFHSTPTELIVHLGYAGAALVAIIFLASLASLLARTLLRPQVPLIGWAGLLLYEISRMPFESMGIGPFHYTTVLLAAALTVSRNHIGDRALRSVAPASQGAPPWRMRPVRSPA